MQGRLQDEAGWVTGYKELCHISKCGRSTSGSTRASSPSACSSPCSAWQDSSSQGTRHRLSSFNLRSYTSVGHTELWRWLWLDFSIPVKSPVSKLLRKNMRNHSLDHLDEFGGNDGDVECAEDPSLKECVGLSRMVAQAMQPMGEGSMIASIFTLVSSAMGAGCLSLPFMLKKAGMAQGLLMLCLGAVLAHISLVVLMSCARYTDSSSLSHLVRLTTGRRLSRATDFVIAVYGIAAVLCYMIFIGDFFSSIVHTFGLELSRETLIVALAAGVVWPLSLPQRLSALRHVCIISVAIICITAVAVGVKTPGYRATRPADSDLNWWSSSRSSTLQSFSIALFAFAAHTNAVPVAASLGRADGGSIWCVSLTSVFVELAIYSFIGIAGYLSFAENTKQDFILNYDHSDMVMLGVRCVYGIVVCLGAPINLSPAVSSILKLACNRKREHFSHLHAMVVTAIVVSCTAVAVCSSNIASVIGLIGSSFGSLIVLAIPAMLYKSILFDLHPRGLANFLFYSLAGSALLGFAAFGVQLHDLLQGNAVGH